MSKKVKFGTDKRDKRHERGGLGQKIGQIVCLGRNIRKSNQRCTFTHHRRRSLRAYISLPTPGLTFTLNLYSRYRGKRVYRGKSVYREKSVYRGESVYTGERGYSGKSVYREKSVYRGKSV